MPLKKGQFTEFAEELKYLFQNGCCILFDEDNMHDEMEEFLERNGVRYTRHHDRQHGTGIPTHVFYLHEYWKER